MANRNVSPIEKVRAVHEYMDGKGGYESISRKYNVSVSAFMKWVHKYKMFGENAFVRTGHNASYSKEFKQIVINDYLSEKGSFRELAIKYKIPSHETVRKWILKYNGHEELKASRTGGNPIMTNGRTTTFEERIEIIQYCISHEHNYAETAEKYHISYQQARSYTIKYERDGVEALRDRRGKPKPVDEMNELERLRAENKLLKAEKERAEMEISFLKKLEEIERRRG